MTEPKPIDPKHKQIRPVLRVVGPVLLVVGGLLFIVGIVNFLMSMGSMDTPWLFMVCAPIGGFVAIFGIGITHTAYAGRVARYMSQEYTPVMTDTFNYAADQTQDGVRKIGGALAAGMQGAATDGAAQVRCRECDTPNDTDAKFCDHCGGALQKTVSCADCGERNDPDARFCDNCGTALA